MSCCLDSVIQYSCCLFFYILYDARHYLYHVIMWFPETSLKRSQPSEDPEDNQALSNSPLDPYADIPHTSSEESTNTSLLLPVIPGTSVVKKVRKQMTRRKSVKKRKSLKRRVSNKKKTSKRRPRTTKVGIVLTHTFNNCVDRNGIREVENGL